MTIKEVEALSGMTRANIRFYESEGLLSPIRNSNEYRDYSENDLEVLKRIKLLRTLHISLEEIKSLHTGEQELVDALNQHLAKLELDRVDIETSQEICEVMRRDGVQYQTLDAQHYLDAIENTTQKSVPEFTADAVPMVRSPWRRFFARSLDFFIYSALWLIFLSVVMNVNIANRSTGEDLLDGIITMLLMVFIEPAMLSHFGTTVGKWILGLSVSDNDDRRLSYSEALSRTWKVLCRGMGLNIPFYNLVRQWKSYKACNEGEILDWECYSTIVLRDEKSWRIAGFVGAIFVVFGVLFMTISMAEMPKHRGEITVAEFCENYNRFSDYFGIDAVSYLDENGKWAENKSTGNVTVFNCYDEPEYIFTVEDGVMTGMQFSTKLHNSDEWPQSYQNEMVMSIMSFVRAQKECNPLFNDIKDDINKISESPFENFQFSEYGVTVTCEVNYFGYMNMAASGVLWPDEGAETDYTFSFSMVKE